MQFLFIIQILTVDEGNIDFISHDEENNARYEAEGNISFQWGKGLVFKNARKHTRSTFVLLYKKYKPKIKIFLFANML